MILIFEDKDENIIEDVFSLLSEKIQIVQVCPDITQELTYHGLSIHPYLHRVVRDGKEVSLSRLEFATLFFLANHPGWVFSRAQIYEAVWDDIPVSVDAKVECMIYSIRKKLRKYTDREYIQTVWGVGYKFDPRT